MSLKIGIVGLPNVGKSTLFAALTKISVAIAPYPFTTVEPHVGVVAVPDERLMKLAALIKPERVVPATIEFVDIAGLVKGAAEGQGLGNQFLSHIYGVDAILFLLRAFQDPNVPAAVEHPEEEFTILRAELGKKDEEIRQRAAKRKQTAEAEPAPLLTGKPAIVVCNAREPFDYAPGNHAPVCKLALDCKLELEMAEMSAEELSALGVKPRIGELIKKAYEVLGLITFYTVKGGRELHAWPIRRGTIALEAGGVVHSDFREKFIRAEIVPYLKLVESSSWQRARELGWIRTEGRGYVVQDGDVIEFKI